MLESKELGMLNPNNDLSYYAIHCPAPVKNRDFVLQVFLELLHYATGMIFSPMNESHIIRMLSVCHNLISF